MDLKEIKEIKGLTLIALTITIVVLLILAGITINYGINGVDQANENKYLSELNMVQNAVLQRYTKAGLTKEDYPGEEITALQEVQSIIDEIEGKTGQNITLKGLDGYYKLTESNGGLKNLGIKGTEDEYIVNYTTGEVINISKKVTDEGKPLYVYAKESSYIADGLVLHLDAINNTGKGHEDTATIWKDLSGNNNDAIIKGGATWGENYLSFDGVDDYGGIKDSESMKPENQTIEVIVNQESKEAINRDGRAIYFVKWPGYTLEINKDGTFTYGKNQNQSYLKSNTKANLGEIYSVVGTYETGSKTAKLYLNGVYENQHEVSQTAYNNSDITIGSYSTHDYLNGKIYSIRMYNRALSEDEILSNYKVDCERYGL